MVPVHILIPNADNNNVPFPPATDTQFRAELARLFGGSSVPAALIAGEWVEAGKTYFDDNRDFMVFTNGLLVDGPKIAEAVTVAKALYAQLKITVLYLGQAEIL